MIESTAGRADAADGDGPDADPALLRMVLGARLRKLREAAGISGQEAGRAIRASHSKISRLEAGRVGFRAIDIDDLLSLYGVEDEDVRSGFLLLAERANASVRWQVDDDFAAQRMDTYLALEDAASAVRSYAPGVIPELLQTAAYAHAVSTITRPGPTGDVQRRVELLMRRQRLLRRPDGPKVWLAIEEAVLRRPFGGLEVWRDQLDHVAEVAERTGATVQIVPDHIGGPAICAVPFTLLRFDAPDLSDIVHLHHATGAQFLDRRGELDAYHGIWDRLCVHAAPPGRTRDLISAAIVAGPTIPTTG
ncbi:helix-turn-helix transcriptional regulator [Nocardia sp. BMG51109]|uniref:helix-turn-helix domain-containing protein n=1 Tax=Nocardia sp. BMG51109 TaxID=1056816 RepID=UPI0004666638|nr:helix-turn-helix transcriptional regulator [Nocardia sp. BMG51109]